MLGVAFFIQKTRKFYWVILGLGVFVTLSISPFWMNETFFYRCLWSLAGIIGVMGLLEGIHWMITRLMKEDDTYIVCVDGKVRRKDSTGKPVYTAEELLEEEVMKRLTGEGSESDSILEGSDNRAPI